MVHAVVDAVLLLLSLAVLVPTGVLFMQLAAAWRRPEPVPSEPSARSSRASVVVLMPAHDEADGIGSTLASILSQLGPNDRVLVVADNCSDDTAEVARRAGADVAERHDRNLRGKGYALDFGVRWLAAHPPDQVLVLDADCVLEPGALERLVECCAASARPVQALYLMRRLPDESLAMRIAHFAWIVRNKVRPLGADSLGWPCQLMGTGMTFPWAVIRTAPLASGHLVEDMELGLDLAARGLPPLFCPDAVVTSVFPADKEGAASQRTRWEHGHLAMIANAGPRLLGKALARRDAGLLGMALDLMVPPLVALVLLLVVVALLDAVSFAVGGSPWPFAIAGLAAALLTSGILMAWHRDGRAVFSARELMGLPLYIAAKLPIYFRLFTRRQVEWVRTKRDGRSR